MNSKIINHWAGVFANVGVIIGLAVLIYELNQNRQLLRAQLGSDTSVLVGQAEMLAVDDSLAEAMSLAVISPSELTDKQLFQIDAYLRGTMAVLTRESYLVRIGVFEDDPAFMVNVVAGLAFQNPVAVAWWAANRHHYGGNLVDLMDTAIESGKAPSDLELLQRWKSEIARLTN